MLIEIKDDHSNIRKAMNVLYSNNIEYKGVNIAEADKTMNIYHSFGGSDIAIYINNTVVGEIQKIDYNTITKELIIECIDFIHVQNEQENMAEKCRCYNLMTSLKDAKIKIAVANEYGHKRYREIRGVSYVGEKAYNNVDDVIASIQYVYSFNEITAPLNINRDISIQNLIENSDMLFIKE